MAAALIYALMNPARNFAEMQVIDDSAMLVHKSQNHRFTQGSNEYFAESPLLPRLLTPQSHRIRIRRLQQQRSFLKVGCLISRISIHANQELTKSSSRTISTGVKKILCVSKNHLIKPELHGWLHPVSYPCSGRQNLHSR